MIIPILKIKNLRIREVKAFVRNRMRFSDSYILFIIPQHVFYSGH